MIAMNRHLNDLRDHFLGIKISPQPSTSTSTNVGKMLAHMERFGPASAATLAKVARLKNYGLVSALLKTRINSGEVERIGNKWRLNPDWSEKVASELRDARMILERAGYLVSTPGTKGRS